jgi:hypothetical protein
MARMAFRRFLICGMLAAGLAASGWAQPRKPSPAAAPGSVEPPDSARTRAELSNILGHYPPELKSVLQLDPALLDNSTYLASYPALQTFLRQHPEVARNPAFYIGSPERPRVIYQAAAPVNTPVNSQPNGQINYQANYQNMWESVLAGLAVFLGFAMALGLVIWLIRTWIDYRRWSRLYAVQTEVHTKLLDRFAANEDLLAYIQSAAGSKFLESSPISLDAGPRSVGAPMGRILWSVQAGVVLAAAGIGLRLIGWQIRGDASQPFTAMGFLAIALGAGFAVSAIISYMISRRLGLIAQPPATRVDRSDGQA